MSALTITAAITDSTLGRTWRADNVAVATSAGKIDNRIVTVASGSETTFTIDTNIGNAGQMYLRNLDTTNYVEYGFSTGVYPLRLNKSSTTTTPPGGPPAMMQIVPGTTAIYLRANTADCIVEIMVHEA